jgi:hypothetical protein
MLRTTDDILELRHWAEDRGARPCRVSGTGQLLLAFDGDACAGEEVGWDEFESTFCHSHRVFVYDDAPDSRTHFIGDELAAHGFFVRSTETGQQPAPPEL